jgi:hypothetical protein
MNLLFLIPLIGYGIFLQASSTDGTLLWLTLISVYAWWLSARPKRFDLAEPVRFIGDRVWLGEHRLSLFPPLWGSAIRNRVFQVAFLEDPAKTLDADKSFSSHIGFTSAGELVPQPISNRTPHALLIGPSGSGKTELMRLIATQFDAEIWAIDFNTGIGLKDVRGVTLRATERDSGGLELMHEELLARGQRALNPKLLLVVDDLGRAMQNPNIKLLLHQIASRGRVLNVMLLLANQTMDGVPRTIWVNCANRFSLGADLGSRTQLGFTGQSNCNFGDWGEAELLQGQKLQIFRFPLGFRKEKTAPVKTEAVNPLLSRVSSRPQ